MLCCVFAAEKVLSGETKLCLTTSSLGIIATSLRKFSDSANEYPSIGGKKLSAQQQAAELQRWRDHVKTLFDFVLKVKALKVQSQFNSFDSAYHWNVCRKKNGKIMKADVYFNNN